MDGFKELMAKQFDSKFVEDKWVQVYSQNPERFKADPTSIKKKSFSITIPPPNITGSLHIGHALNITLQDIIVRFKRMQGYEVLWVPGTDHAGIATQHVVSKSIEKKGLKRENLKKEEFLDFVRDWEKENKRRIKEQIIRAGASVDWTRERFTLDEDYREAVFEAFQKLYNDGLIYRDRYIVSWCPKCLTSLSDLEVELVTEKGKLYFIKYPVVGKPDAIPLATTRPETMLGDTAVAVNPNDERYKKLLEEKVKVLVPIAEREVPLISDNYVQMDFGTGALKITPFHDFQDFEIAKRHNLEGIKVIDEHGKMIFDSYYGITRFEAREKILKELSEKQLLLKIDDYEHKIGKCYRCAEIVEPLVSEQWFLNVKSMSVEAKRAVQEGKIKIIPDIWEPVYYSWLDNIRDWCLSRQIWWGHEIPVAYCQDCKNHWVYKRQIGIVSSCPKCNSNNIDFDKDVLDTWFSSSLWPFATLGWPKQKEDLKRFYPTSLLVTGFDILFFWVARMIMMGLYFCRKVPFEKVYIHALIRDEQRKKMSKTRGNVVDLDYLFEKYGVDATRFSLAALSIQGRDIILSEKRFEGFRNFTNKVWNASRFVISNTKDMIKSYREKEVKPKTLPQKWILHRLNETITEVTKHLEEFKFNLAAMSIYDFFWSDFCDWYIEISKVEMQDDKIKKQSKGILLEILINSLKLLHPFMPFITEEIWSYINSNPISFSNFHEPKKKTREEEIKDMNLLKEIVLKIRILKDACGMKPSEKSIAKVMCSNRFEFFSKVKDNLIWISKLSNSAVEPVLGSSTDGKYISEPIGDFYVSICVEGINLSSQIDKFEKELIKAEEEILAIKRRLSNADFLEKAPKEVIEEEEKKSKELSKKIETLRERIKLFQK